MKMVNDFIKAFESENGENFLFFMDMVDEFIEENNVDDFMQVVKSKHSKKWSSLTVHSQKSIQKYSMMFL